MPWPNSCTGQMSALVKFIHHQTPALPERPHWSNFRPVHIPLLARARGRRRPGRTLRSWRGWCSRRSGWPAASPTSGTSPRPGPARPGPARHAPPPDISRPGTCPRPDPARRPDPGPGRAFSRELAAGAAAAAAGHGPVAWSRGLAVAPCRDPRPRPAEALLSARDSRELGCSKRRSRRRRQRQRRRVLGSASGGQGKSGQGPAEGRPEGGIVPPKGDLW